MHFNRMGLTGAAVIAWMLIGEAKAGDWPQWCGTDGKNMVSPEKGLPESFVPGEKKEGTIDLSTAKNVKWGVKACNAMYSTPVIVGGKVFVGGRDPENGLFVCLDAATGKTLWKWQAPPRGFPKTIDGFSIGLNPIPRQMGVCATAAVDGDGVYFVNNRMEVICLHANGNGAGEAKVLWKVDMVDDMGVFPCDAANGSPLIDGDLLYVQTSNGVDRNTFSNPAKEVDRKFPAPDAPNLIVLDKKTGRLVATDDLHIAKDILHGQWSSPSMGMVGGRKLIFFGGGDGRMYAFEALSGVPDKPVKLNTVWSYDCIPPEYKPEMNWVVHYCLGDKRVQGTLNKHDGTFVGMSEIIGTPVILNNRIYVAIGRDPEHGRGRGAMYCIDATGSGDITKSGRIWSYQGLDRTLATASVADGLVYISDVAGRLHCLDQETGKCYWVYETKGETWGSTLVADGKIYMPTPRGISVLATGKELKELAKISLGSRVLATPVVANGTMYVVSTAGWVWAVEQK